MCPSKEMVTVENQSFRLFTLVEHKTGDQRVASSRLTAGGVIVLCP